MLLISEDIYTCNPPPQKKKKQPMEFSNFKRPTYYIPHIVLCTARVWRKQSQSESENDKKKKTARKINARVKAPQYVQRIYIYKMFTVNLNSSR